MASCFGDDTWTEQQWAELLAHLVSQGLLSWKEVTTLTLGNMNPSQVGTSLASSPGFQRKYGKGNVMAIVMDWFYEQDGTCHDCRTRLELQADHDTPRETYQDPLDADFIENMVLRCRRCNVIKRPSHALGGQTHLTAESALMWILFTMRPRTLSDFVRMCRLYGMTMADVRMQEGWAMAHWLQKAEVDPYVLEQPDDPCSLLLWPDGGVTRCWEGDVVPDIEDAQVVASDVAPAMHVVVVAQTSNGGSGGCRIRAFRYRVGSIPFSHYLPDCGAEALAIAYSAPKRGDAAVSPRIVMLPADNSDVIEDETLGHLRDVAQPVPGEPADIASTPDNITLMAPRGMNVLAIAILGEDATASVSWEQGANTKSVELAAATRTKKVCDMDLEDVEAARFRIS